MKIVLVLFALALGCASAQTPSPVVAVSNFPSGSTFPSSTPSDSPSALATPSPLAPTSSGGFDVIENSPIHETFAAAIMILNSQNFFSNTPGITIFAPTDAAWSALVSQTGRLIADIFTVPFRRHLECFMLSHVVQGVDTENVLAQKPLTLTSLSGFDISVSQENGQVLVDGSPLDVTNVPASNGVVHFLNTLTIIPTCIGKSVGEQAETGQFLGTTYARIVEAGLVDLFTNESPLTVLVPTDEAWSKLPANIVNFLGTNATALSEVLSFHVIRGVNRVTDITQPTNYTTETMAGDVLTIMNDGGSVSLVGQQNVGTALEVKFLQTDGLAQNGLFSIIDEVLIPPSIIFPTFVICFPEDGMVDVKGAGQTMMKDLKIGDEVMTSYGTYDKVYSFGHNQPDVLAEYLKISTKETAKPLQLSKDHMVFVDSDHTVTADSLKVGDKILLDTGKSASITKIATVYSKGAYAPFTQSGSIVVDGIVASSYIAMDEKHSMLTIGDVELPISYQWMSHAAQAPHRVYCRFFECDNETYTPEGRSTWIATSYTAGKFMLAQGWLVQMMAFLFLVPFFALCAAFEVLTNSPVTVVTGAVGVYSLSSMYKLRLSSPK